MNLPECAIDFDHDWIEVSTIGEATIHHLRTWICTRCGSTLKFQAILKRVQPV